MKRIFARRMMRYSIGFIFLAFLLACSFQYTFADDAPMAIFGETLVPVKTGYVQLIDEDIEVITHVDGTNESTKHIPPEYSNVAAVLRFKNLTKKEIKLLIGFPLDRSINEFKEGEFFLYKNFDLKIHTDGKHIVPRILYDKKRGRTWFVWEQVFPANQVVSIKHDYKLYWGGNHIDPEGYDIRYFQYILTTGALWAGSIGHATVNIRFDKSMDPNYYYAYPNITKSNDKTVNWEFENIKPESELTFAYSWAKNKASILSFMKEQDQRARAEGKSIVQEIKDDIEHTCIPKNLKECFVELEKKLAQHDLWIYEEPSENDLLDFKNAKEDELTNPFTKSSILYDVIGDWLKDTWDLRRGSMLSVYFNKKGISDPNVMAEIILKSFHRHLNHKDIKLEEQIRLHQRKS